MPTTHVTSDFVDFPPDLSWLVSRYSVRIRSEWPMEGGAVLGRSRLDMISLLLFYSA